MSTKTASPSPATAQAGKPLSEIDRLHLRIAVLEKQAGMVPAPHPSESPEVHQEHFELPPTSAAHDPISSGPRSPRRRAPLARRFEVVPGEEEHSN